MTRLTNLALTAALAAAGGVGIATAATDYSSLQGLKGAALKEAVKQIAAPHKVIPYQDPTWEAFSQTDVRMIRGEEVWMDMYSNRLVYVAQGHAGMNIEHSVANSWWGGKSGSNEAYCDLHHLNPSDADANNRKNDNPLGEIAGTPTWTNGLTNIGAPRSGQGGGSKSVFEPADEYKGNFARAYFYIFTVYDNIPWQESPACMYELNSYPTLQPWAYEMLLDWAAADPVDEMEALRNAAVAEIQENENPFISLPGLAEYIWGDKRDTPFNLEDAAKAPVANRPEAPSYGAQWDLAAVNTYSGKWWNPFSLTLYSDKDADIYYTLTDSDEYQLYEAPIEIGQGVEGASVTIKAYAQTELDGKPWKSSLSSLTLTAFDPEQTDYQSAKWELVTSSADLTADDLYVVVSVKNGGVMGSTAAATSSSGYIANAGNVVVPEDGELSHLPDGAGIVTFVPNDGGEYYVAVSDLKLNPAGYLLSNKAKFVSLAAEGRAAELLLESDGVATLNFGTEIGTLQYNASSPRFSVYTSNQEKISLYRYVGPGDTVKTELMDNAPESIRIFTLQGFEMPNELSELPSGLYLIVSANGSARKLLKP